MTSTNTSESSQTRSAQDPDDGSFGLTEASSGTSTSTQSGNSISGTFTSESDSTGSSVTTTSSTSIDGLTWMNATVTTSGTSENDSSGNSVTGTYTQSSTSSVDETIAQTGATIEGNFTFDSTREADTEATGSGNSITGTSASESSTLETYSFDQVFNHSDGSGWEVEGTGTRTLDNTSTADGLTGEYSTTTDIEDSYRLEQTLNNPYSAPTTIILEGTETATETETGNSLTGTLDRDASGTGTATRTNVDGTVTVTTNWAVAQQGNYLDGQITLDVGGTDRYAHMHNYRPSAASSLGLAGTLDYSATGLPVVPGQGPGAPTGGMASALGDPSVDELMSRMSGSTGSATDPLSGLLGAYGASGYSPALAASGASLDAAFAEVGRDHIHMYCFAAGTPVTMADGTQRAIELLQPNDLILATPDTDPTAAPQPYRITNTYHNAPAALLNLHIGDDILRVTANHPLYIHNRGWVPAGEVNIGDEMLTASGALVSVTDKFDNGDIEPVYNLHIAGARTYFVGEHGVLVHNTSPMLQALIDQSAAALVGGVYGFLHDTEVYFGGDGSITQGTFEFIAGLLNQIDEAIKTGIEYVSAAYDYVSGKVQAAINYVAPLAAAGLRLALGPAHDPVVNFLSEYSSEIYAGITGAAIGAAVGVALVFAPPVGLALLTAGVAAGTFNGYMSTYAMNHDASFYELAIGAGMGAVTGILNPVVAIGGFVGGAIGGGIEAYNGGEFFGRGYAFGSAAGGLAGAASLGSYVAYAQKCGASWPKILWVGLRSVTPELAGGAVGAGAGYALTGTLDGAIRGANAGMMLGSLARFSSTVRNFADPRRGVCFAAGTLVEIPGDRKPIEEIREGELVLSRTDDDPTAPIEAKVVEEVFVRTGVLWRLRVAGREIFCTAEHPFFVQDQGWTPACQLHADQRLSTDCDEWVAVESIGCTDVESEVYNFRVKDYHTYFVGGIGWRFSVWAHNAECILVHDSGKQILRDRDTQKVLAEGSDVEVHQFLKANPQHNVVDEATAFYHATSQTGADDIISSGVDLRKSEDFTDFGRGFYTTRDYDQAVYWAHKKHDDLGVVVRFEVLKSRLDQLDVRDFGRTATIEWQTAVWQGRNGILDHTPLSATQNGYPYDMVQGLMITNRVTQNYSSAFNAKGTGDQQAWITRDAIRILQELGVTIRRM